MTSDVDVAFMRKVLPTITGLFERTGGDLAMLPISPGGRINPANAFVRATPRSVAFYAEYLTLCGGPDVSAISTQNTPFRYPRHGDEN